MGKTQFTTITPLPPGVSRPTVLSTLHNHLEMIDLNPAHTSRSPLPRPPPEATAEEYHCTWYTITDHISYFPGYKGKVTFKACFHDLGMGVQIHVYAPMGLDIREKWTLGGNEPGEEVGPREMGMGIPVQGLYLREDVELRCSFLMTGFVKKQLKDALKTLVDRLVVKSQLEEAKETNRKIAMGWVPGTPVPGSPPLSPPSTAGLDGSFPRFGGGKQERFSAQTAISEMDGGYSQQGQQSPAFQPQRMSPAFANAKTSPGYPPSMHSQHSPRFDQSFPVQGQQQQGQQGQYPQQHSPGIPPYNPAAYAPAGQQQRLSYQQQLQLQQQQHQPPMQPHPYHGQNGYGPAELPS